MLTMHGKAYRRIFDLHNEYEDMIVANTACLYIYYSDFTQQSQSTGMNHNTATFLRTCTLRNIPWAQQYKYAINDVINSTNDTSGPVFVGFAKNSRAKDGAIIGQPAAAPEIAAILYPSGQRCTSTQPVVTYPKARFQATFLALMEQNPESLQFPFLFRKGERGWSKGHTAEQPPNKS